MGRPTAQPHASEPTGRTRAQTAASPDNLLVMGLHCGCLGARDHTSNSKASPQARHSKWTSGNITPSAGEPDSNLQAEGKRTNELTT